MSPVAAGTIKKPVHQVHVYVHIEQGSERIIDRDKEALVDLKYYIRMLHRLTKLENDFAVRRAISPKVPLSH